MEVAGTPAFSEDAVKTRIAKYLMVLEECPQASNWQERLREVSQMTVVVNGCMLDWSAGDRPWNVGYIKDFWSKFESGERIWDSTLERKGGGYGAVDLAKVEMKSLSLRLDSSSSVMALVRAVTGLALRTGTVPENLRKAFMSIKVTWLFGATAQEIVTLGMRGNLEQHARRKHNEIDNILQVSAWMQAMPLLTGGKLNPEKAIDVMKYATTLGDPLNPGVVEPWTIRCNDWLWSQLSGRFLGTHARQPATIRTNRQVGCVCCSSSGLPFRWLANR
jgi:hypothetical protein